ncbi:MAG TPA: SET domain-containing protein-lysine N-methyltransferase [Candidatus Limnocylindria bacterium]|jgi:SET domain-containing protein|nr:SET domain-containing protein-lysine N-methyltransferase [Candidatus Limnocylindria bacterium]
MKPGALAFEIRQSSIHGSGAFSTRPILRGERVVAYLGEPISKAESAARCQGGNPFIFYLDELRDIDGAVDWNPAKYLNHSCDPNCEAALIADGIWLLARRRISIGEELTFDYGYDLTEWRSYPCRCGAARCLGYIVAEAYRERLKGLLDTQGEPQH